jgi:putative flippase GtrA
MNCVVTARCRLARFSMVGAIGVLVQGTVLYLLSAARINYLVATAVAVESAILHNFIWHRFFTWPDRQGALAETLAALFRFNLSNGLISLVGNLALMALFGGELHWPLLPANLLSITICALANFAVSDRWVFISESISDSNAGASASRERISRAPASGPTCAARREDK